MCRNMWKYPLKYAPEHTIQHWKTKKLHTVGGGTPPPPPPPPRSLRSLAGGFQEIWNAPCGISVTYKMLKRCILFPNKLWISRIMVYQFSSITIPEWYGIHIDTFYHVHKIRKTRLQLTFDITPINHKSATRFMPGGGGGVLRCCLDGGARLKPPNPYPSLRVILAEKGTHY